MPVIRLSEFKSNPLYQSRRVGPKKRRIPVFNPHTFGANAEVWVARFLEIVSWPPRALARGMPNRFAHGSPVPSPVPEETHKSTAYCIGSMTQYRERHRHLRGTLKQLR
jgi:hypothetical protein